MNDNIVLEVLDAIEIAEMLEYMLERLEHFAADDPSGVLEEHNTYSLDDLRTDVVRLTNTLYTSPFAKLATVARVNESATDDGAGEGQP